MILEALLFGVSLLVPLISSHNIALKAHSRECFHENLHRDDKMTVSFQVGDREFGGSGNLDVDFYVRPLSPFKSPLFPVTDSLVSFNVDRNPHTHPRNHYAHCPQWRILLHSPA